MQDDLALIREHFEGILIVNDAVGLISYADGLHIGQEDLKTYSNDPLEAVRKIREIIGDKMLGLSTHNKAEILEANELDIDYIGLGAYRSTLTKSDASVGGAELIDLASLSRHPVAIIGGVRLVDSFPPTIRYKVIGSDLMRALEQDPVRF
jgi:thiamine-phosphate pyrophosphorylase